MKYELTQHAKDVLAEREIPVEWLEPFPVGKVRRLLFRAWCRKVQLPCGVAPPLGLSQRSADWSARIAVYSHSASVGLVPTGRRLVS